MSLRGLENEIKARGYRILYTSGKGDQPDYDRFTVDALFPNGKIRATAEAQLKVRGAIAKQSHPDEVKRELLTKIEELTRPGAPTPEPPPAPVAEAPQESPASEEVEEVASEGEAPDAPTKRKRHRR